MAARARELAREYLTGRAGALKIRRGEQAALLLTDLETDLADRLREIQEEEERSLGLIDEKTRQLRLFGEEVQRPGAFQARRAVAEAQAEFRRREIAEFEQVEDPEPPRPLGALFMVPEDLP